MTANSAARPLPPRLENEPRIRLDSLSKRFQIRRISRGSGTDLADLPEPDRPPSSTQPNLLNFESLEPQSGVRCVSTGRFKIQRMPITTRQLSNTETVPPVELPAKPRIDMSNDDLLAF
jgi:hypothetical protein